MAWLKLLLILLTLLVGSAVIPTIEQQQAAPVNGVKAADPPKRKPILPWRRAADVTAISAQGGPVSPDGTEEISCDLPAKLHIRNVGGTDGAGLCVWASQQHTAYFQHVWAMQGVFDYMKTQKGGGWPERVDQITALLAKKAGVDTPAYVQVQAKNNLEILKLACRTGRMPGVTYSFSPTGNYNRQFINHMVTLVHASDKWFCILDNNFPSSYEWMDPQTFLNVHTRNGRENGWATIFLNDPPPAPPKN